MLEKAQEVNPFWYEATILFSDPGDFQRWTCPRNFENSALKTRFTKTARNMKVGRFVFQEWDHKKVSRTRD